MPPAGGMIHNLGAISATTPGSSSLTVQTRSRSMAMDSSRQACATGATPCGRPPAHRASELVGSRARLLAG